MTTLSVVMPAYNESKVIEAVVGDIVEHILDVVPESDLVIVDDCSTDDTHVRLDRIAQADARISVLRNDRNSGHGPTLRRAIDTSDGAWVFHLDSDGQVDVADFARLWERRGSSDLLIGTRIDRDDPRLRLVLTFFVRSLATILAGARVRDANSPFKLVSRPLLDHLAPAIPTDTFAPSILLVLGAHRCGAVVTEVPITHRARPYGTSSLALRRLARAVAVSAAEAVRFRFRPIDPYPGRAPHGG